MLQVKNLLCTRNGAIVCKGVDFFLLPGHAVQLLGPNGIGKTTLLRTMAGLLRPFAGCIAKSSSFCYVGHKSGMHPNLSVVENLAFVQTFLTRPKKPHRADIFQALDYFDLRDKANCKLSELSAGQIQRLNLARLCLTQADLWLLDEPLANLDVLMCKLVSALCQLHLQRGGGLVFASHNTFDLAPYEIQQITLESHHN